MLIKSFANFHGSLWIFKSLSHHSDTNFKGGIFSADLSRVYESTHRLSRGCFLSRASSAEARDIFEDVDGRDKLTMS